MISIGGDKKPTGLILFSYRGQGKKQDPFFEYTSNIFLSQSIGGEQVRFDDFDNAWSMQTRNNLDQTIQITRTIFFVVNRLYQERTLQGQQTACLTTMQRIFEATKHLKDEVFIVPWAWGSVASKGVLTAASTYPTSNHFQFYKQIDAPFVRTLIEGLKDV